MPHTLASLGQHSFLEGGDSRSALTCVLTGVINVPRDGLELVLCNKGQRRGHSAFNTRSGLHPLHVVGTYTDILSV